MDRRGFNRAMGAAGRETGYGHAPPDEARRASWLERNVGIPTSAQGLGDFNRGLDRADQQITNDFIDVAKNSFSGRPGPAHTEDGRKLVGGPVLPWMLTPTGTQRIWLEISQPRDLLLGLLHRAQRITLNTGHT